MHGLALQQHVGKPGVQPELGQVLAVGQQGAFGIDGSQLQQQIPGLQQGGSGWGIKPVQAVAHGVAPGGQLQGQRQGIDLE